MTTIAYKDGIVAYDGLMMFGDYIYQTDFDKCEDHGAIFFCSGNPDDAEKFIDFWMSGIEPLQKPDVEMIVVEDGVVYQAVMDGTADMQKTELTRPWAIGSGWQFAVGAMDAGVSAEDAVRVAACRDPMTGGTIRTYQIEH